MEKGTSTNLSVLLPLWNPKRWNKVKGAVSDRIETEKIPDFWIRSQVRFFLLMARTICFGVDDTAVHFFIVFCGYDIQAVG